MAQLGLTGAEYSMNAIVYRLCQRVFLRLSRRCSQQKDGAEYRLATGSQWCREGELEHPALRAVHVGISPSATCTKASSFGEGLLPLQVILRRGPA